MACVWNQQGRRLLRGKTGGVYLQVVKEPFMNGRVLPQGVEDIRFPVRAGMFPADQFFHVAGDFHKEKFCFPALTAEFVRPVRRFSDHMVHQNEGRVQGGPEYGFMKRPDEFRSYLADGVDQMHAAHSVGIQEIIHGKEDGAGRKQGQQCLAQAGLPELEAPLKIKMRPEC